LNPNEFVIFQTPKKAEEIVTSKVYHHFDGFLYEVAATTDTFMGIKPKNIEQECAMQLLIDQRIHMVCLSGKAGSGKAQPLYSQVLTPSGYVEMGDLNKGDFVIGDDGLPAEVLDIYPQGKKDIYRVYFSDGSFTDSCDEHIWSVKDEQDRNYKREYRDLELKEIMKKIKGHDGRKNYSIPLVKPVIFDEKQHVIDPYLFGVLLGDGCMKFNGVYLSTSDSEILESFKHLLPKNYYLQHSDKYDYRINNIKTPGVKQENVIQQEIIRLNLKGSSSIDKFIPNEYKFDSVENRIKLLQGLMDSDGTCDKSGQSIIFTTVSSRLAEDMEFIVNSLGGVIKSTNQYKKYKYKGEMKIGKKSHILTISLPIDISPFRLSRKNNLYINKSKYLPSRYITDVEFIGNIDCQCIYVNNESHRYVTDNFIVTHNTILALAAAMDQINAGVFNKIIVIKPIVPVGGKDIGALPGDKFEKLAPWLGPISDNFAQLCGNFGFHGADTFEAAVKDGLIEVEAMAYIQGRSIPKTVILVDEAQNLTPREARNIVERCGEGSKIILLGDVSQIENNYLDKESCGLAHAMNGTKTQDICGCVTLKSVTRSPLAAIASEIFSSPEAQGR